MIDTGSGLRFTNSTSNKSQILLLPKLSTSEQTALHREREIFCLMVATGTSLIERMRIDSTGNILIRTTTDWAKLKKPIMLLSVPATSSSSCGWQFRFGLTTACQIAFADAGDSRAGLIHYQHSDNTMRFYAIDRLTSGSGDPDSSGRLLQGCSEMLKTNIQSVIDDSTEAPRSINCLERDSSPLILSVNR